MAYDLAKSLKGKSVISIDDDKTGRVLVLGVGNYLMGDEGIGVHIMYEMDLLSGSGDIARTKM